MLSGVGMTLRPTAAAARVDERPAAEVRRDQEAGAAAEHVDPSVRQRQLPPA